MADGKLVRDRIPEIIREQGREPIVRTIQGAELFEALVAKVAEEAEELRLSVGRADQMEELADLLEVVNAIARHLGIELSEVEAVAGTKRTRRGGFTKGLWLAT
jgi:predicted house-cleaning noncanonical NTP pyrophosphatase (MazG superfamily)